MLVLSREKNESIVIGHYGDGTQPIVVTVVAIRGDKVRLGIEAPRDVPVHRKEVAEAIAREGEKSDPRPSRIPRPVGDSDWG